MLRSFDWLALRQLRTRRLRALLTAFGIVLGVGMVFAVLLLVATIRQTFDELIDSAYGNTDAIVSGQAGYVPASDVDRIRDTPGVGSVTPWIGTMFTRLDSRGRAIEGNDEDMLIAAYDPAQNEAFDFQYVEGRPVRSGREVVVADEWAGDHGIAVGDRIPVATGGGRASLRVVGTLTFEGGLSFAGPGLSAMPLASARALMGIPSGFNTVNVTAANRSKAEQLRDALRRELGTGFEVRSPDQLGEDFAGELGALNVVLYFFSGVALFVGGFLILNSFNMTVLQRTREIGMLRTLGAPRRLIVRTLLIEAIALGLIGTALGLGLGIGLGLGLIELMRGLDFPVADLEFSSGAAVVAVATGLLATTMGAFYPAWRAGRMEPIRAVLGTAPVRRRPHLYRVALGLALLLPGLILGGSFWFGGENSGTTLAAIGGIGLTMAMFVGMAVLAPFVVMPLIRALAAPFRLLIPAGGRLASDSVRSNPARTSATAAALMIGLAVVVTNAGMSGSFLNTVKSQIDSAYARDFTIAPIGTALEDAGEQSVPGSLRSRIERLPDTGVVTPLRSVVVDLPALDQEEEGLILGIEPGAYGEVDTTPIEEQSRDRVLAAVGDGGAIVGRLYARKAALAVGDRITLRGPDGSREVPVAGVLNGIDQSGGMTMQISLSTMRAVYGVTTDAQLAVAAASAPARTALERDLGRLIRRDYPNLELLSSAEVKQNIEDDVNQQFAMFNAILVIAVVVSLLGVVNTLAMSVMERTREIGVLRALGSSRWQVRRTMLDESLLITIAGGLVGIAFGTVIAWTWVKSLEATLPGIGFSFPVNTSVAVAVAAVLLGVLAAILPARRAARLKVIDALNYE
jgi:putative ABC transport system permease protein